MKKRPKKPRPRASGEWTEAVFWQFIRSVLRSASRRWPPLIRTASDRRRRPSESKTNNRLKWEFQCEQCDAWFARKDIQVDHKVPAGSLKCADDLPGFVSRLFVEADGLAVLCKAKCHAKKTEEERRQRTRC